MTTRQHLAVFEDAAPQSTWGSAVVQPAANPAAVERCAYRLFRQAAQESSRPLRRRLQPGVVPRPGRDVALAVPLGYQLWLAYLFWLEEALRALHWRATELSAAELAGVEAVARARSLFLRAHQFCARCEAANPRHGKRCRRCAAEL